MFDTFFAPVVITLRVTLDVRPEMHVDVHVKITILSSFSEKLDIFDKVDHSSPKHKINFNAFLQECLSL